MENQNQFGQQPIPQVPIGMQPSLPNATTALVLGIVSIPTCCCGGFVGLVCGILAIVLGNKAMKLYMENPAYYNISSYNNANAGKICGIIGTVFSALFFIYWIIEMIIFGAMTNLTLSNLSLENFK